MPILFLNEELCSFILQLLSNLGCSLPGNFWQIHLYSCAHSSAQPTSVWTKKSTAHLFLRTLNFLNVYLLFSSNFSGAKDKINRSLACQALYQSCAKSLMWMIWFDHQGNPMERILSPLLKTAQGGPCLGNGETEDCKTWVSCSQSPASTLNFLQCSELSSAS